MIIYILPLSLHSLSVVNESVNDLCRSGVPPCPQLLSRHWWHSLTTAGHMTWVWPIRTCPPFCINDWFKALHNTLQWGSTVNQPSTFAWHRSRIILPSLTWNWWGYESGASGTSVPPQKQTWRRWSELWCSHLRQYFQSHLQSPLPGLIQFQELVYLLLFTFIFFWLKPVWAISFL